MMTQAIYSVLILGSVVSVGYFVLAGTIVVAFYRKLNASSRERLIDIYGLLSIFPVSFFVLAIIQGSPVWRDVKSPIAALLIVATTVAFISTVILMAIEIPRLRKFRMAAVMFTYSIITMSFFVVSASRLIGFNL